MKLIFAASNPIYWEYLLDADVQNILHSFAYKQGFYSAMKKFKPTGKNIMIDSGAFSAWNMNKQIDIDEYIDFCKDIMAKYPDNTWTVVNLDVIPGKPGTIPTQKEIEYSAKKGWENYMYMKSKGLNPMHIFHQHEDFKWLKQLMSTSDYIGISPDNSQSVVSREQWLKRVYSVVQDKVKTHGFACTSPTFLKVAPFYTADSSSWLNVVRYGVLTYFDKKSLTLKIFKLSNMRDTEGTFEFFMQKIYPKISQYLSVTPQDLFSCKTNTKLLLRCNIEAYLAMERAYASLWEARGVKFIN